MVFSYFSKEKALERTIKKALHPHVQSMDRMAALEKLRDNGSPEALLGICKRFSFVYDKSISDQQEKDWVVSTLVELKEHAVPPLVTYMQNAASLGYPLAVLPRLTSEEEVWRIVDELLEKEAPGYTKHPKKRMDVIEWLGEWEDASNEDVTNRITGYLEDFDETVRFKTVEALDLKPHDSAAAPLIAALLNSEEESHRLKQRIAEVLSNHQYSLGEHKDAIKELFADVLQGFKLKNNKLSKTS